jgi:hypothetical protein
VNDNRVQPSTRLRDWTRAFLLTLEMALATAVFPIFIVATIWNRYDPKLHAAIAAAFGVFLLVVARTQFSGILFNGTTDRLSFPQYFVSRSVTLSEIQDANAETISGGSIVWELIRILAKAKGPNIKQHAVNLSGDFGSRRIRFYSRQSRDQFLSLLRKYAPQARVTRGTGLI